MKPYCFQHILHVLIFTVFILTLDADSEDLECSIEIRVRRNTVYKVSPGEKLRINCTVVFCNNSLPTVSWHKADGSNVPVSVSSDSHIETKWTSSKDLEGVSYLIFKNILKSDSGQYQCQSGGSMSHVIDVSVSGNAEPTTATKTTLISSRTTLTSANTTTTSIDTFWPYVYRVVGIMVFAFIVILLCVIPKRGCRGKSRKMAEQSDEAFPHIYENDL